MPTNTPEPDTTLAGLTLRAKASRCGRPGCTTCPHPGYWHVYVPAELASDGHKHQVYLGKAWTITGLTDKVNPLLTKAARAALAAAAVEYVLERKRAALRVQLERVREMLAAERRRTRENQTQWRDRAVQLQAELDQLLPRRPSRAKRPS